MSLATKPDSQTVPPTERFWQRYSPHHELPLSSAGSLALHVAVLGILVLLAVGLIRLTPSAPRPVAFYGVQLAPGDNSSGPGSPGRGDADGKQVESVVTQPDNLSTPTVQDTDISPAPTNIPGVKFPSADLKPQAPDGLATSIEQLRKATEKHGALKNGLPRSPPGPGGGTPGPGGGTPGGPTGDIGTVPRELRWHLTLSTSGGEDYLAQIKALHGILGIPTTDDPAPKGFFIVRDFSRRPPLLMEEDVAKLKRIQWVDDRAESVRSVMSALKLNRQPRFFVAYFPAELEEQMRKLEWEHRHVSADKIAGTWFEARRKPGGYELTVVRQTQK